MTSHPIADCLEVLEVAETSGLAAGGLDDAVDRLDVRQCDAVGVIPCSRCDGGDAVEQLPPAERPHAAPGPMGLFPLFALTGSVQCSRRRGALVDLGALRAM